MFDVKCAYDFKKENVAHGAHRLRFVATDKCGNEAIYEKEIEYENFIITKS